MAQINAYLTFNGNCREAMIFYKECLGGTLTLHTIKETPMAARCPAGMQDHIMHSSLTKNGLVLMATDMVRPEGYKPGNTIALSLNCSSEEEINKFFNTLSEGGTLIEPLREQSWGALFGMFIDRFGMAWMLNYDKKQPS